MAGTGSSADRIGTALLAYAVALAAVLLIPPYIKASVGTAVGAPPGFTGQEALDLLTPVVVLPLAWRVLDLVAPLGRRSTLLFFVIAAVWVEGQAIHLGTNAIGDAFQSESTANAFYATDPGALDHWLDEVLSHWLWHVAWVALTAMLLAVATLPALAGGRVGDSRGPSGLRASEPAFEPRSALAGLVHGVTFFLVSVEGVTTLLGIPASVGLLAWAAVGRRAGRGGTVTAFMLISTVVTLVGYVVWAALNHGQLPEFSKVGLFR